MALDLPLVHQPRELPQNLPMRLQVHAKKRPRPNQRPHKRQRLRHEHRPIHLHLPLHNAADLRKRRRDVRARGHVHVDRVRDEDVFERVGQLERVELRAERFAVVDDVRGAHLFAEGLSFRARGGSDDDGELQDRARDLRSHGADAPGAVDDEEGGALGGLDRQPLDQGFVGGDVGQRHGGCLHEVEGLGFQADGAGVHELVLRVAAVADGAAGVEDLVAGLEVFDLRAEFLDNARAVEAENLIGVGHVVVVVRVVVVDVTTGFDVDGVH